MFRLPDDLLAKLVDSLSVRLATEQALTHKVKRKSRIGFDPCI